MTSFEMGPWETTDAKLDGKSDRLGGKTGQRGSGADPRASALLILTGPVGDVNIFGRALIAHITRLTPRFREGTRNIAITEKMVNIAESYLADGFCFVRYFHRLNPRRRRLKD